MTFLREYKHVPNKMMEAAADAMAGTSSDTTNETVACVLKTRRKKQARRKQKELKISVTVMVERSSSSKSE